MNGRALALGIVAVAAAMGAGLWYASQYAWVDEITGLSGVVIGGETVPVAAYRGIDGNATPLKLRGCFTVDPARVTGPAAENPAPLVAPGWFDCFDAAALGAALEAGQARAVVAEAAPPGFRRVVAVFPDGRAFQWREVIEK